LLAKSLDIIGANEANWNLKKEYVQSNTKAELRYFIYRYKHKQESNL
jgi:hypothetical protein